MISFAVTFLIIFSRRQSYGANPPPTQSSTIVGDACHFLYFGMGLCCECVQDTKDRKCVDCLVRNRYSDGGKMALIVGQSKCFAFPKVVSLSGTFNPALLMV
jgi:hypothetical protein